MKLASLSEKLLKHMVKEYKSTGKDLFSLEVFKKLCPSETDDYLSKALYLLQSDDLVKVFTAENVADSTVLKPNGIRNADENTLLKKGYLTIKEIKSWI